MTLRPYQSEALDAVLEAESRGIRRQLVVLATGSGKTVIAANLPLTRPNSIPMLFLAHREELLTQAKEKIEHWNPELSVAIEQGTNVAGHVDVVVASVPTLGRAGSKRLEQYSRDYFKVVVVDEAHHGSAETYQRVLKYFESSLHVGITATPQRGDNVGLSTVFDEVVYHKSIAAMINDGWLSPLVGYRLTTNVDLSSVRIVRGDFVDSELSAAINVDGRNEAILQGFKDIGHGQRKTIVFCVDVAHALAVADHFNKAQIPTGCIYGAMSSDDRHRTLEEFHSGKLQVLTNVSVLIEGFDEPSVDMIIMARPTQSSLLYTQCLDSETEVLTQAGWKTVESIHPDDIVAAPNPHSLEMDWKPIQEITTRPLGEEQMYGISSPQMDIRVTAGHRMLYKKRVTAKGQRGYSDWMFDTAENMATHPEVYLPVSATNAKADADISDRDLEFLGWWLSDGSINRTNKQVSISQNRNGKHYPDLVNLLEHYDHSIYTTTKDSQWKRSAPHDRFFMKKHSIEHLYDWLDKGFPSIYETLSPRQWSVLLETYNYGNGAKTEKIDWVRRTYIFTVRDEEMADGLQAMLTTSGFRVAKAPTRSNAFTLHIKPLQQSFVPIKRNDGRATFSQVPSSPDELVWCVSNENTTLVTRRNGKVAILGNCIGRGLRLHPGKEECLVVDIADIGKRPIGLPSLMGLPPDFDVEGKDLLEVAKKFHDLADKAPGEVYSVRSLADIDAAWERIDLFSPPPPNPALLEYSAFIWNEVGPARWWLGLGNGSGVSIISDPLGRYIITYEDRQGRSTTSIATAETGITSMTQAFGLADDWVNANRSQMVPTILAEAKWRGEPPTDKQIKLLRRKGVPITQDMTKGEASQIIDRIFKEEPRPQWLQNKINAQKRRF